MFQAISEVLISAVVDEKDDEILRRKSKKAGRLSHFQQPLPEGQADNPADSDTGSKKTELEPPAENSSDDDDDDDDDIGEREKWVKENHVLLHMIGYTVGLSNIWRFPALCYEFGGVAFLIPYTLLIVFCAYPFLYLELLVGQFTQAGAIACWKLAPLFKGVGICMVIMSCVLCINLNTVLAWCCFYLFQTIFFHPLPWISCDNGFGKLRNGQEDEDMKRWVHVSIYSDASQMYNWHTENCSEFYADTGIDEALTEYHRLPGTEYFRGRVQRMWTSGFADRELFNETSYNGMYSYGMDVKDNSLGIGEFNDDIVMSLLCCCLFLCICVSRGAKLEGKFMGVAVFTPYVVLSLLLFRATGLKGSLHGLKYFTPKFEKLLETQTWWKAAEQVFFSNGCGLGIHLTLASHSSQKRNILYDASVTVGVNSLISVLAACVIYMFLGHVETAVGRSIDELHISGPELAFEVMADVLGELARANFYSFCFYFMLFLLGMANTICSLWCAKTSFIEILPHTIRYKTGSRLMILSTLAILGFFASCLNLTRGGLHVFAFTDKFVGSFSMILSSAIFYIAVSWFWGIREVVQAAESMGIGRPSIFFQICWKFSGIIVMAIFFRSLFDPASYVVLSTTNTTVNVPLAVMITGLIFAFAPLISIPLAAIHTCRKSLGRGWRQKLLLGVSPTKEHKEILLTGTGKRTAIAHYFYLYAPKDGGDTKPKRSSKVAPESEVTGKNSKGEVIISQPSNNADGAGTPGAPANP